MVRVVLDLRYATANPVPFGVDRLAMMLFLKFKEAVVDVELVVWKMPVEPKSVPDDVAFR